MQMHVSHRWVVLLQVFQSAVLRRGLGMAVLTTLVAASAAAQADPSHNHCGRGQTYVRILAPNVCHEGRLKNLWEVRCKVDGDICSTFWEDLGETCTPLVIDLGADGFQFTDSGRGVSFDIDADGDNEHLAWTAPNANDAFLVLDRNGNDLVDDGGELFGSATRLLDGSNAPNGYEALAEFDLESLGGNHNGYIDPIDAYYWHLQLWTDGNHDGISQPDELHGLFESGVIELALTYEDGPGRDEHGNILAFASHGYMLRRGRRIRIPTIDVCFMLSGLAGRSR
jgi:hypothetical protein